MKLFVWKEDILIEWGDGMAFAIGKDIDEAITSLLTALKWKINQEGIEYWKKAVYEEHDIIEGFSYGWYLKGSA